ncbi:hypothetical protein [Flavobacterium xueshanense]|uniref:hypothetical protein n=1 Tax=Flavobacterium xueshanense TaxID=935223 RepID=UPI00142F39DD|nr:hypothetical protein [Flavobacterium xueshanense]
MFKTHTNHSQPFQRLETIVGKQFLKNDVVIHVLIHTITTVETVGYVQNEPSIKT